ncbi:MAG: pentapeptide repeat-containing protein [Gaiellaceae bacterium]
MRQSHACVAALVLPLVLAGGAEAAVPARPRAVDAADLVAALAAGRPVVLTGVEVRGALRLPPALDVPLVLRRSRLLGGIQGAHRSFSHVVDLSESEIRGRLDLAGARFGAPVTFARAQLGAADLALAVFDEAARFDGARFEGAADFSGAEFHGSGSFAGAIFGDGVSFASAEFGSFADFSTVEVAGAGRFAGARFVERVDFAAASFDGSGADPSLDFHRASFEDGATFFLADVAGPARFSRATSSGDLSFQDVRLRGDVDFSTVRFLGPVSFSDALVEGSVSFDQADVAELDLQGARFERLRLPFGRESGGRIRSLRLDLDDAALVDGPGDDDRPAQEAALALLERGARAADDLETANDARVRRLTIARERKGPLGRSLDLSFNYGVWGYGVRPYHQLIAIAGLLALGAGVRWARRRPTRPSEAARLRGAAQDLGETAGALLRLRPPDGAWSVAEYLVFKLLIVTFVLNAGNVWPVSRELIEGIF